MTYIDTTPIAIAHVHVDARISEEEAAALDQMTNVVRLDELDVQITDELRAGIDAVVVRLREKRAGHGVTIEASVR